MIGRGVRPDMAGLAARGFGTVVPSPTLQGWAVFASLMLPCLIFPAYLGIAMPVVLLVVAAAVAAPRFRTITNPALHADSLSDRVVMLVFAAAAITLVVIGGAERVVPITTDWLIRDAVLHDLVAQPWPFSYAFDGGIWTLRAPLGMYMLPALVGKIFGIRWAWSALAIQNSAIVFIIFRILLGSRSASASVLLLSVFCVFSGWDVVGKLLATGPGSNTSLIELATSKIEWWASAFQYSSNITLFVWVQNHAIGGWLVAALLMLWDRNEIGIAAVAMGMAMAAFWSPFALIGGIPFLAKAGAEALSRRQIGFRDVAACALLAIALWPVALYLTVNASAVPAGFWPFSVDLLITHLVFVAVEIMPFVVLNHLYGHDRGGFTRSTYVVAITALLLIPLFHMGSANDFVMRASIPALAILAVTTGHTLCHVMKTRNSIGIAATVVALSIGAITPLNQILLVLGLPFKGISNCDLIEAWDQHPKPGTPKSHYFAQTGQLPALIRPDRPYIHATGPTTKSCRKDKI